MSRIMLYRIRLSPSRRIDQLRHHQTLVLHTVCFRNRERVSLHRLDWSPYIDDLDPAFEKLICFVGEMVRNAGQGRAVRLVNVYTLNRATKTAVGCLGRIRRLTTDGVVEDVDAGCTGAGKLLSTSLITLPSSSRWVCEYSRVLQ
jgi:hypothetical protein